MTGGFGKPDIPGDSGFEQQFAKVGFQFGGNILGEIGALIEHGEHDALDGEPGIEILADTFDGVEQLANAFQGKVFGLHGNQHGIGGNQSIEREQIERRGTVEYDVLKAREDGSMALRRRYSRSSALTSSILAPIRFLVDGMTQRFSMAVGCRICSAGIPSRAIRRC